MMTRGKWNRLTESKSAILFFLTSTVQAIVLIYLQSRIFARNVYGWLNLQKNDNTISDTCLASTSFDSFMVLTFESVMFIFLYLFQLYFCINALLHKNTIQIFTIALTNFCYVALGVIQFIEAKQTHNKLLNDCPTIVFDPEFMIREIPNIMVITFLAFVMGYLSFKLYQQFGWSIYQKIGDDIEMQKRYRTRLIFLMLLKLNILLILLFSILIIPSYISGPDKTLVYIDFVFFVFVILFDALAYESITEEYNNGMIVFLSFWIVVMGFYLLFFYIGVAFTTVYGSYIGSIFGSCFLLLGASTFATGLSVKKNFGKGLKEYLNNKDGIKKIEQEYENNNNEKGNVVETDHDSSKKKNEIV